MSHRAFFWSVFGSKFSRTTSFALCLGFASPVVARAENEPPSGDEKEEGVAAELFDAGLALLESGRHSEACSKLEASQRLDPQVGTLMYWAYCLESQGLTAQARDRYREAEALARDRDDERQETARQRAEALELQLQETGEEAHPQEPRAAETSPTAAPLGPRVEDEAASIGTQRTIALIAGGVGIVGLGLGTVFGLQARSNWNEAKRRCPELECARREDLGLEDDARANANFATVAFAVGGAALAGGVVLWFTASDEPGPTSGHSASGSRSMTPADYRLVVAGDPGGLSLSFGGGF